MNPEKAAKFLIQKHPKGDLWDYAQNRPIWPDEWSEWRGWSTSEKKLYFLALNLWNGAVFDDVKVDLYSVWNSLDREKEALLMRALGV